MEKRVSKHPCLWDGGDHGVAGLSAAARRLWVDHSQHSVPAAGSPLAAAKLCLAGLRSLSGISSAQQIPQFLAGDLGGPVALGHRGACPVDQACRDPCDRRRVPAALRREVGLSDVRSTLSPFGHRDAESQNARPCHFLYPRSLNSLDLFCLSSSLSIASDERPSTIPITERLVSAFATITCTGLLVAQ